jgi:hypothetical protein
VAKRNRHAPKLARSYETSPSLMWEGTKKAALLRTFSEASDSHIKSFVTKIFQGLGKKTRLEHRLGKNTKLDRIAQLPAVANDSECMLGAIVQDNGMCLLTLYQRKSCANQNEWQSDIIVLDYPYTIEQIVKGMAIWAHYMTNVRLLKGRAHVPTPTQETRLVTEFTWVPTLE